MAQPLRGLRFNSQHPPVGSQPSVTAVPGDLMASLLASVVTRSTHGVQTYMHANSHTHIFFNLRKTRTSLALIPYLFCSVPQDEIHKNMCKLEQQIIEMENFASHLEEVFITVEVRICLVI